MNTFKLSIITPEGHAYDDHVESLTAPGAFGLFGILAKHTPMIVALKKGVMKVKDETKELIYVIQPGVLEVNAKGEVVALVDQAVSCPNVDDAKLKLNELQEVS